MVLPPRYGQAYLWSNRQRRPASTITANRTPSFTYLKEKLSCGGVTSENTRSLLGSAIFCTCQVGCHIRNLTLRRRSHFAGWLCEVRQSQLLSICLTISGLQLTPNRQRGTADECETRLLERHCKRIDHGDGNSTTAQGSFCLRCIR